MVRAIVTGVGGRMGGRLAVLIGESEGIRLVGGVERPGDPRVGADLKALAGGDAEGVVTDDLASVIEAADVVLDFTAPEAALQHLRIARDHGRAMVIGTTGFDAAARDEIARLARDIPCVLAPNMSLGVNLLFRLIAQAARALGDTYDVEIVEIHHRMKKDAPSGTALKMAEVAAQALGRDLEASGVYARHGLVGERTPREIGVQALRAGDIVGEHTIIFGGLGERLEMTHRAHTRDTFGHGAIRAATWVVGRPPGLYDMADVLGLIHT